MKKFLPVLLVLALFASLAQAVDYNKKHAKSYLNGVFDKVEIDIEDDVIILTPRDRDDVIVEITPEFELYVNGDEVELTDEQQEIVKTYYEQITELIQSATYIGMRGAKIGVRGAALGLTAMVKVVKLLDEDYDEEDLEREMKAEAEKLEAKAQKLQEEAEELKVLAEKLEKTQKRFEQEIEQIRELDMF